MYKCSNCNAEFEKPDIIDDNGEKWNVCPSCRGADFDEVRQRSECDKFLVIKKAEVLDYVVTAIAFINKENCAAAKETLIELIAEMVGENPFEYKSALNTVTEAEDKLIAELQGMLEVVKV